MNKQTKLPIFASLTGLRKGNHLYNNQRINPIYQNAFRNHFANKDLITKNDSLDRLKQKKKLPSMDPHVETFGISLQQVTNSLGGGGGGGGGNLHIIVAI